MTVAEVERGGEVATGAPEQSEGVRNAVAALQASKSLQQFAADGAAAVEMAKQLAPTPFVPKSYKYDSRNKSWYAPERVVATVAAAWLAGDEIGLRPMQSLASIDVIEGVPALNARAMRALVQAAGHEIWTESQPDPLADRVQAFAVTIAGKRKGQDKVERVTWTWRRAQQAGLTGKKNWENTPIDMLIARATSAVCRLIASDVLMGLAYSSEELQDSGEAEEPEGTTTVRRGRRATAQPEADAFEGEEGSAQPGDEPVGESGITDSSASSKSDNADADRQQQELDEVATPERPAVAPTSLVCGAVAGDGKRVCSREPGHEGKHNYSKGMTVDDLQQSEVEDAYAAADAAAGEPESAPAPVEEPERGSEPSEVPERTEQPEEERGGESEPGDAGEEGSGGDGALFEEPSQEELDRAFEAEQEERRQREAAAAAEAQAGPAVDEGPLVPPVSGQPVEGDDPWVEFR